MTFSLSLLLDRKEIKERFATDGYVHIRDVLLDTDANRIYRALLAETPWNLVFTDRGKHIDMPPEQLDVMDPKHLHALQKAIYAQAEKSFQYCYNNYPIFDAVKSGLNEGHTLHDFFTWLNEGAFLDFAREVSGFDDISFLDAQATRYKPGHFLTVHDDAADNKNRRVAYVFGFTQDWPTDWGGLLQLLDASGNVEYGIRPQFNCLNLFKVPRAHNVSLVAPFAGGVRFSVSGWLRHGDPE